MSKQTLCNYCLLKVIRKLAKAKKKKVTILVNAPWRMVGVNIYVHPPSVVIHTLKGGEDGERAKYRWSCLKGKIGDSCSC